MIIAEPTTMFGKESVFGEKLIPSQKELAYATYVRHGRICGIHFGMQGPVAYARFTPGYQLPPIARDEDAFGRFTWRCENDLATELQVDENDGEIYLSVINQELDICRPDMVDTWLDETIDEYLEFLLGDTFHDELVEFVRSLIS